MTTAATTLLGLALPVTGELSGTWGDTVNNSLTALLDTAVAGTTTLSADTDVTLSTTTLAANQARQAVILWTAGGTATRTITAPAQSKTYVVINKTSSTQSIVIRGAGPTTGVTIVAGEKCLVVWNGVDFVKAGNTSGAGDFTSLTDSGNLTFTGTGNRITGDFSNATIASRVMFQSTTVNGNTGVGAIPNGTAVTSAWQAFSKPDPTNSSEGSLAVTDGFDVRISSGIRGTGTYLPMTFYTGGSERVRIGTSGLVGVGTASATSMFQVAGSSSVSAMKTPNIAEVDTISATAATGTINYDITTQSVLFYTTNASGNWTVNFRGSSGTTLDTVMQTGESISATFLVTQGATAYYNSAVTIDGTSVTPKWQGGTAPTSGNASSVDCYTYVIQKTGSATFVVLASQTKFA